MKARVRNILHTVLLLTIAAIAVQAQPSKVATIPWASQHFTTIGGLVFFTSQDSLWRTDGTAEGTIFLRGGFDGFWSFREFNGMLYFLSDVNDQAGWQELWRSDGTPEGTIGLKSSSAYDIVILQPAGGYLYFVASDHGTGRELYRTNGTPAGTAQRISCGGDCGSRLMKINEQFVPGVYLVNMKTNGVRISKWLLVK